MLESFDLMPKCTVECCRYPYNNFLHHHVENIIMSCLESKNSSLVEHLLRDCDIVVKIIQAEKNFTLESDADANKVHDLFPLNLYHHE